MKKIKSLTALVLAVLVRFQTVNFHSIVKLVAISHHLLVKTLHKKLLIIQTKFI